jgi:hypothetical protein
MLFWQGVWILWVWKGALEEVRENVREEGR